MFKKTNKQTGKMRQKSGNSLLRYKKMNFFVHIFNTINTYHKTKLTNQTLNILMTVNRSGLLKVKCEFKKSYTRGVKEVNVSNSRKFKLSYKWGQYK